MLTTGSLYRKDNNMAHSITHEIRSHTSLRGLAALMVVLVHFQSFVHPTIHPDETTFFFYKGYLWVDFFFILSGFVMSYVYNIEHPVRHTTYDTFQYLIARIARIYPLHFVSLIATLSLFTLIASFNWFIDEAFCCVFDDPLRTFESLVGNLFLVHAWGMFESYTWNYPSWSLSVEFFCYLIFATLLTMESENRKLTLLALSCTALFFYCLHFATNSDIDTHFELSAIRAVSAFTIGILLFFWRKVVSDFSDRHITVIQIAICSALLFSLHIGITDILSIILMAILVLVTWEDRGYLCSCLNIRPLHAIGLLSFSIYMWHYLFKFIAQQADWENYLGLPLQSSAAGSLLFILFLISLVVPVAIWSYHSVEIPARKWVGSKLNHWLDSLSPLPSTNRIMFDSDRFKKKIYLSRLFVK